FHHPQGQANPPDAVTTHKAWVKAQKEIARLMLMTMDPEIRKTLEHLGAYDIDKCTDKTKIQENHQKNGQTRTRGTEEHKRSQGFKAKAKKSQLSVNYGQPSVKIGQTLVNRSQPLEDKNYNVSI
ncbi:hypothetical protein Tco_1190619, partial [Tanacetum coccineum]